MSFILERCSKLYHPILDISRDLNPSKAAMTIGIKIRLVIGTYFLQEDRAKYASVSPAVQGVTHYS
jgi:hypothetical protein